METMLIQVKVKTAKRLKGLKLVERESYDGVITRACSALEKDRR